MAQDEDGLHVRHMMNGVVLNADVNENLVYLARLLLDNNANAIIVREGGAPKGIVTTKDILRRLRHADVRPHKVLARDVMSEPLVTINHDDPMHVAWEVMRTTGFKKLPVKNDYDVVGLFIQDDLIRDLSWYR